MSYCFDPRGLVPLWGQRGPCLAAWLCSQSRTNAIHSRGNGWLVVRFSGLATGEIAGYHG